MYSIRFLTRQLRPAILNNRPFSSISQLLFSKIPIQHISMIHKLIPSMQNSLVRSTEVCWATELIESANLRKCHLKLLSVSRARHHRDNCPSHRSHGRLSIMTSTSPRSPKSCRGACFSLSHVHGHQWEHRSGFSQEAPRSGRQYGGSLGRLKHVRRYQFSKSLKAMLRLSLGGVCAWTAEFGLSRGLRLLQWRLLASAKVY